MKQRFWWHVKRTVVVVVVVLRGGLGRWHHSGGRFERDMSAMGRTWTQRTQPFSRLSALCEDTQIILLLEYSTRFTRLGGEHHDNESADARDARDARYCFLGCLAHRLGPTSRAGAAASAWHAHDFTCETPSSLSVHFVVRSKWLSDQRVALLPGLKVSNTTWRIR